jgi:hypothetical protein
MSFGIPINIATAAMEDIYERLCWIYIPVKNTHVYDHVSNTYHLSDLDITEKNTLVYDQVGKTYHLSGPLRPRMVIGEKSITIEGIPLKDPVHKAGIAIGKVQSLPTVCWMPAIR